MYLIFDTETTGLPKKYNAPLSDSDNWPRLVQLAWQLHAADGKLLNAGNLIVQPEGFTIPFNAEKVHGISTQRAIDEGEPLEHVLQEFSADVAKADVLVGHNLEFDLNIVGAEYYRVEMDNPMPAKEHIDTKEVSTDFVAIPGGRGGRFKWPTLTELYKKLFGEAFADAHDAAYDVDATARAFFGLITQGVVAPAEGFTAKSVKYERPKLADANFSKTEADTQLPELPTDISQLKEVIPYSHLHLHTQFSILQSTISVKDALAAAREAGMKAIAITDLGNLHAAFNAVNGQGDDLQVIIGSELYVAKDRKRTKFTLDQPDERFQQVLLAKNQVGYHNLSKLSSIGYIEGYYSGMPRVDKDLIVKYKSDLIALSGNLQGEVPKLILNEGEEAAEAAFAWWVEQFEDDFYVELMRHNLPEEQRVNQVLLRFAKKYKVKCIATNDVYHLKQTDAPAHEVLLCVKDGKQISMEKGFGRRRRLALPNDQFYFKTAEEMNLLFADLPEALKNIDEVIGKCKPIKLKRDILLPKFPIPKPYTDEDEYLRALTLEGAKTRYEQPLTQEVSERIDHELAVIKNMGFPGYFLIVQDFIQAARDIGVSVGPGRGSAAGSIVAYCTGITNIDPIKYQLLFERFLNPERISMPDIDIDFDDRGRQRVIDFVVEKYGKNQVAQIITYGTMAAKMSIKDVGRVLEFPLPETNALANMVPSVVGTTLNKAFGEVEDLDNIYREDQELRGEVLRTAVVLEGSVRNTGIHAAGVIIAPDDLLEYIPVCVSKDADLLVTQFDGKVVEDAGMLKMDFLGLKTLTIIADALALIKQNHKVDIDIDEIPLEDEKTFKLYQKGETVGTFQFESEGMRNYLRQLKPTNIEDLIAMNALYRPGPMDFIPNFIDRKQGREKVEYPHELLEPILHYTYGIMVYQEQIMQAAQIMAGYSLGGADLLRRAMGKKKMSEMEKQRVIFVEGAAENHNIAKEKAEEVFSVMEKFAAYGFNRSHSAAYSVVAYQTAYLKANYPAEYMAAVLTNWIGNIDKLKFFLDECRAIGAPVLAPDINESLQVFNVNDQGAIRFGMAAIKGAGEGAVIAILEEREKNGPYTSFWDFAERMPKGVNKKTLETLAQAGAFDGFKEVERSQLVFEDENGNTGIELLAKYSAAYQEQKASSQVSLFGGGGAGGSIPHPKLPAPKPEAELELLKLEHEVLGIYLTGHPLDPYKSELNSFCVTIPQIEKLRNREVSIGGLITEIQIRQGRRGDFALFTIEDYEATVRLALFGEHYLKNQSHLVTGAAVVVKGKVEERYNQPGTWELSPRTLAHLSTLSEKIQAIEVKLDIKKINEALVQELQEIFTRYPGKCNIQFKVLDKKQNIELPMQAKASANRSGQ